MRLAARGGEPPDGATLPVLDGRAPVPLREYPRVDSELGSTSDRLHREMTNATVLTGRMGVIRW